MDTSNMTTSIPIICFRRFEQTWQKGSLKNLVNGHPLTQIEGFQLTLGPPPGSPWAMSTDATGKFVKTWQESKSAKGKEVKCEAQRVSDLFLGVWKTWTFVICDIFSMRSFSNKRKADLNTRFSLDNVDEYHFWVDPKFPEVQRLKMICSEHSSQHESKEQNIRKASRMTYLFFRWKHLRAAGKLDRSVKMVLTPKVGRSFHSKVAPKCRCWAGQMLKRKFLRR